MHECQHWPLLRRNSEPITTAVVTKSNNLRDDLISIVGMYCEYITFDASFTVLLSEKIHVITESCRMINRSSHTMGTLDEPSCQ